MKKHVAIAILLASGSIAGCASTSELAEVRALAENAQAAANQAQQTADRALANANDASQRVDGAVSAANAASAKADAAEASANRVNEKIDRMFKKTMLK